MGSSAVVTGVGSGIGLAILTRLVDDGRFVVGIETNEQAAADVQERIRGRGEVVIGSVTDRNVLATARALAESKGRLDAWVNNAGVAIAGNLHNPNADEVAGLVDVNLMGVFWGMSEAVRSFIDNRVAGSIVNTSSIHSSAAFNGWAAYDMAKGGVDALTRYAAVEYGPLGVRVNSVAPGAIRTPMVARVIADAEDPIAAERDMAILHPLERLGEPAEIAAVVAFLLSGEASFVSGQSLAVDGAATARCYRYEPSSDIREMQRGWA